MAPRSASVPDGAFSFSFHCRRTERATRYSPIRCRLFFSAEPKPALRLSSRPPLTCTPGRYKYLSFRTGYMIRGSERPKALPAAQRLVRLDSTNSGPANETFETHRTFPRRDPARPILVFRACAGSGASLDQRMQIGQFRAWV